MNRSLLNPYNGALVLAVVIGLVLVQRSLQPSSAPGPSASLPLPGSSTDSFDTMDYQGQQIKLSKRYDDYDVYKEDPNNIAASEVPRVQKLVETTPIAKQFTDGMQMFTALGEICFPGYGQTQCGEKPQPDGSALALFSIEIPRANKERFFLFRRSGNVYTLIDEFIYSEDGGIMGVTASGDKMIYTKMDGTKVIERTPNVP